MTTTPLPCNFPIVDFSKATENEKNVFNTLVTEFKSNNPGLESISFLPETTQVYFTIPVNVYSSYCAERKVIVNTSPYFVGFPLLVPI